MTTFITKMALTMKIGYARVSTIEQNLDLQRDALSAAGCERVIADTASGAVASPARSRKCQRAMRVGDTLVVWRLDRLGRSLRDFIGWMTWLEEQKVGLLSLQESIDANTTSGKLTFYLFGALAEFERNLILERTRAGLTAARARGRKGGRSKVLDKDKRDLAVRLHQEKKAPIARICTMLGISKPTLYAYVRAAEVAESLF